MDQEAIISPNTIQSDFLKKMMELRKPVCIFDNKNKNVEGFISGSWMKTIEELKSINQENFFYSEEQSNWGILFPLCFIPKFFDSCQYFRRFIEKKNIKIPATKIFPPKAMKRKILQIDHKILADRLLEEPIINTSYDNEQNIDIQIQITYDWAQFSRGSIQLNIKITSQYEYVSESKVFTIEQKKYDEFQKIVSNITTKSSLF